MPDSRLHRILLGVAAVLVAVTFGAAGYLVGSVDSEDLDAARAEGATAGIAQAKQDGREQGYDTGFEVGKKRAYREARPKGYRKAYQSLLEESGAPADTPPAKAGKAG